MGMFCRLSPVSLARIQYFHSSMYRSLGKSSKLYAQKEGEIGLEICCRDKLKNESLCLL